VQTKGTIYIIDDDAILRRALAVIVRDAGYAPHPFASGDDFIAALDYLEDGCVLLDVHMPGLGGLEVQDLLVAHGSQMPVIIMTGAGDIPTAVRAIKHGALYFIEKPVDDRHILEMIGAAFERLETNRTSGKRRREAVRKIGALTPREQEVLNGLANGRANKIIAFEIGLSVRTVEMHRGNIMRKLGIHSTAEALQMLLEAGTDSAAHPLRHAG